jgi:hypothetical protein
MDMFRMVRRLKELHRYIGQFTIHDSQITDHVPSVRGLSPPAIDSRMEVSA